MDIINWIKRPKPTYYLFQYDSYDDNTYKILQESVISASRIESYCGLPENWNNAECSIVAWTGDKRSKYYSMNNQGEVIGIDKPESTDDAMIQLEKWIYQVEEGIISEIEILILSADRRYTAYGRKQL
jgi:hypothetical protein